MRGFLAQISASETGQDNQEAIKKTREDVKNKALTCHFPLWVCHKRHIASLDCLLKFEEGISQGILQKLPAGKKTIFLSHRWLRQNHPDNNLRTKFNKIKILLLNHYLLHEENEVEFFWIDYMCIPQVDLEGQKKAIDSLPFYILNCSHFITIYGSGAHLQRALISEYYSRGWCRLEKFVASVIQHVRTFVYDMDKDMLQENLLDCSDHEQVNPLRGIFIDGDQEGEAEKRRIAPMLLLLCEYANLFAADGKIRELAAEIAESANKYLPPNVNQMWVCETCTLENKSFLTNCAACGGISTFSLQEKTFPVPDCAEMPHWPEQSNLGQSWTCPSCNLKNKGYLNNCEACGAVKFHTGMLNCTKSASLNKHLVAKQKTTPLYSQLWRPTALVLNQQAHTKGVGLLPLSHLMENFQLVVPVKFSPVEPFFVKVKGKKRR